MATDYRLRSFTDYRIYVLHMNSIHSTLFGWIMPNFRLQSSQIKQVPLY